MVCAQGSSKSVTQTFPFRPHVLAQNFAKSLTSYFQASVLRSRKRLWSRLFLSSVIRKLYLPASLFICRDYCNDLIVNKQRRPNWKSCMNSLFKKLKDNYTQTFIYIFCCVLASISSPSLIDIYQLRYRKRYPVRKLQYRDYILVIKK